MRKIGEVRETSRPKPVPGIGTRTFRPEEQMENGPTVGLREIGSYFNTHNGHVRMRWYMVEIRPMVS